MKQKLARAEKREQIKRNRRKMKVSGASVKKLRQRQINQAQSK